LNSALALLQLVNKKTEAKLDNEERRIWSMATAGLRRLQTLMTDLLAYSQLDGAEQVAVTVPLEESLQMALTNLQKDLESAEARVEIGTLPGGVKANRSLLTLVFQNLIANAIKFRANEAPRIQIAAKEENHEVIVSVADNGQGFDRKYAEHIFLPFKRLHGSDIPGSGIGLATCKRIIERLGGRIWAEGVAGKGATFYFALLDE
jgi:chemotaxis family two-component system sensor kinase Cph1